jgi:GNAT superfamily N-acetyltransferase
VAVEQLVFPSSTLPESLRWQILSFVRQQWVSDLDGPDRIRRWIHRSAYHPVHYVLVDGDFLISHIGILWKFQEYEGKTFKLFGLGHLFTYPSSRGLGHGSRLFGAATEYIDSRDGDLALLTCQPGLAGLYGRAGWEPMPNMTLLGRINGQEYRETELPMMRFLSDKGRQIREQLRDSTLRFGGDIW